MSKKGLTTNDWILIFVIGAVALWAAIEYLFWNHKPSLRDEVWLAILILYIWMRGHIEDQGERLNVQDKRLEEMESRIEELESQSQN